MKEVILSTVRDSVAKLLYYDRKEDEELPVGRIEQQIKDGNVTLDEIVAVFKGEIQKVLTDR